MTAARKASKMKKKTMQTIFFLLFIAGIVVGYILPGDLRALAKNGLKQLFNIARPTGLFIQ